MREINYGTENGGVGSGTFLMGVMCGAAVGAAVGLLLAPRAGAELRNQLYESTDRLRRRAAAGYASAVDSVGGAMEDVMERGTEAVRTGKAAYEQVRHSAAETAQQVTDAASRAAKARM